MRCVGGPVRLAWARPGGPGSSPTGGGRPRRGKDVMLGSLVRPEHLTEFLSRGDAARSRVADMISSRRANIYSCVPHC